MVVHPICFCGFVTGNRDLQTEFALRRARVRWGAVIPKSRNSSPAPLNILRVHIHTFYQSESLATICLMSPILKEQDWKKNILDKHQKKQIIEQPQTETITVL